MTVLRAPAMSEEGAYPLRLHVFLVTAWSGEPWNAEPDEHDAIAWFTADELPQLTLAHAGYLAVFRVALVMAP